MKNRSGNSNGFTLIEVIVSIAILSIIFIAFLNIYSFSMISIIRARDKSEALNQVQSNFETQLAEKDAFFSDGMKLIFDGKELDVTGGFIQTSKSVGLSNAKLNGFIPNVPTIEISPKTIIEGTTTPYKITVDGYNTNFTNETKVDIYNRDLTKIIFSTDLSMVTPTSGFFSVDANLFNENGDYIVRVSTDLENEVSRAKITVLMPLILAITENSIFVTDNGTEWIERTKDLNFPIPHFSDLKKVIFSHGEYIAVGGSSLLSVSEFNPWKKTSILNASLISGISYSAGNYYISTQEGQILQSLDGKIWTLIYSNSNFKFNDIYSTGDGKIISVGTGIIIIKDLDGYIYEITDGFENIDFNSITSNTVYDIPSNTWSHDFAAVGTNITDNTIGYIISSVDGVNWNFNYTSSSGLNEIIYVGGNTEFTEASWLVVGDSGALLSSNDLSTWSIRKLGDFKLNSAFVSKKRVFVVGNQGKIARSSENNLNDFTISDIGLEDIISISGR